MLLKNEIESHKFIGVDGNYDKFIEETVVNNDNDGSYAEKIHLDLIFG